MIALVLAMLWTRRGQALTLALLSMVAVAAAVAAPAYLLAADRAVAAGQVATALPEELGFQLSSTHDDAAAGAGDDGSDVSFGEIGAALADLPGFDYVYATEYPTIGIEATAQIRSRFTYRQDVCPHLTIVSGRCLIAEGDVVIGEQAARRLHLAAGAPITLTYAQFSDDPRHPVFLPRALPKQLTVVGVYRVADPLEGYWGAHGYFAADAGDRAGEPVFTDAATIDAMDHGPADMSIDGRADPAVLRAEPTGVLRQRLEELRVRAGRLGPGVTLRTTVPDLLDRIDSGRAAARLIVPVIAVPLVLLACLTIYLAVGYSTEGRRPELAVVALRGARWWARWWLATGEALLAVLAGAVAGCLAGQLLVDVIAVTRFPGGETAAGLSSLRYAPLAAAAALLAAVLAQRRQLVSAVAQLLRRAPVGTAGMRGLAFEGAVVVVAAVTAVQLAISGGELTGVGLLAAALATLALALIAARIAVVLITRFAGRALRRGRLGTALAGFQLSRRPAAGRLVTLLVAAVAVIGYAAITADVAGRDRRVVAGLGNGADRVISVQQVSRAQLLAAVRAVDPHGDFAMAAAQLPGGNRGEPAGLAVDTTRLSKVVTWPDDAPPPGEVAGALRPKAGAPIVFDGQDVTVDAFTSGDLYNALRLTVALSSVTGLGEATVQLGGLRAGEFTYQQRVSVCREGCRLKGIQLATLPGVSSVRGSVTIRALRLVNPRKTVLTATQLADLRRWRFADARASAAPDGLRLDVDAPGGLPNGAWAQPADVPLPLPVATAGLSGVDEFTGFDGRVVPVKPVAELPAVPRLGAGAGLIDLEYLDRYSTDSGFALQPQVWLSAGAPADVQRRLEERGLSITGDVSAAQRQRQLDEQGPALSLWFYLLAAGLAAALAAGALVLAAVVDRARRVEDLSALRAQGLDRRAMARSTLWTYPALMLAVVPAGLLIALLVWGLTGWALPLAGLNPPPLPLPGWPHPPVVAGTGAVVLVVLAGVAFAAGGRTHREVS